MAADPIGAPDDGFVCYQVKRSAGSAAFAPVGVSLDDAYHASVYAVKKPVEVCVPADYEEQSKEDLDTHLAMYKAKPEDPAPEVSRVVALDRFGSLSLDLRRPSFYMVPAHFEPSPDAGTPAPPVPGTHEVDHYTCYKARTTKGTPAFSPASLLGVDDDVTDDRDLELRKPRYLCAPTDAEGQGVINAPGHLLCYAAAPAKGEPRHLPMEGAGLADELGSLTLDTRKEKLFCAPALVDPACGDDHVNQASEVCDGGDDAACPSFCQGDCTCTPDVCGNFVAEAGEVCDGPDDAACPGACSSLCTCPGALPLTIGPGSEAHAHRITDLLGGPIPLSGDVAFEIAGEVSPGTFEILVPTQVLGPIASGLPIVGNVCVYLDQDPALAPGYAGRGALHCGAIPVDLTGNAASLPQSPGVASFVDHCVEGGAAGVCDTAPNAGGGLVDDVTGLFVSDGAGDPECDDPGSAPDAVHDPAICNGATLRSFDPILYATGDGVVETWIVIQTGAGATCDGPSGETPVRLTLTTGASRSAIMDAFVACTAFSCPVASGGSDVAFADSLSGAPFACPDVLFGDASGAVMVGTFPALDVPQALSLDLVTTVRFALE
jgi:hypothetical protein